MGKTTLRLAALALGLGAPLSAGSALATTTIEYSIPHLRTNFVTFLHSMLYGGMLDVIAEDPTLLGGSARHDPWSATVNGTPTQFPGGRSSFLSTFLWGGYEFTDHLSLPANQRFFVGAYYRHDRAWGDIGSVAELSSHNNALGIILAYTLDTWHFAAAGGFSWGGGTLTSQPSGASGSFDSSGYDFGFQVGRAFALWGDAVPAMRPNEGPRVFGVRQISVYLDPAFRVGYSRSSAYDFTDSSGAQFGKDVERAWTIGGSVTLSAVLPQSGGTIWRPYISFGLDRQVGYRHTLDLPASGQVARLDHDKTFWSVSGGVGVWLNRNVSLGVGGFYRGSGSQDSGGGLAWVRINLLGPGGYLRGAISR
jgi:hypothetical protein